jgi:hypothetical protein
MTIAANAVGQAPVAADAPPATSPGKAPPGRTTTATADPVQQPEAR